MAKCGCDSPCASSTKKRKYATKYQPEWATEMDFICASDKGTTFAYCRVCNVHINVSFGGKYDIVRHSKAGCHVALQKAMSSNKQLKSFFVTTKTTDLSANVLSAEVKFSQFVAEHNLPFSVADHFTKLAKRLFPDSDIAGKFACGRMKTTMIVKKALAPRVDDNVVKLCQSHRFSLLTDESNDQGGEKTLAILVKVYDPEIARAVTRFVDIPICNIGTGENIFQTIDKCFRYLLIFFMCKLDYLVNTIISYNELWLRRCRSNIIEMSCHPLLSYWAGITELF